MSKRAGGALFLAMALLFWIANRGAYKGYFQDDELDNLSWAAPAPLGTFVQGLVTPRFHSQNFRPAGHFYFHVMGRLFDLDFPKYLIPIHALHFFNVWLVWTVARRLGAKAFGASAGALFFAFHMAVFDAYWKPMYVFDVLCATFCLLSLLFYIDRRWVLSFAAFWLAYKSKELAVMLPAVLFCYAFWFDKRRWKPLVPFFAVSLSFGIQALLFKGQQHTDYAFQFTQEAVLRASRFYAAQLLLLPYAGFVLPLPLVLSRERRAWFGLAAMLLFFVPLAFLPERTFGAYCYLPLAGLAIGLTALQRHRALVILFFLLWIPWNEYQLRRNRRQALAIADENHRYVSALAQAVPSLPDTRVFVYDGTPSAFHRWGIQGALRCLYHRGDVRVTNIEDADARQVLAQDRVTILSWEVATRSLFVTSRAPATADASYITMDRRTPLWQLLDGWYGMDNRFRWMADDATARLRRPQGARQFELVVNISPVQIRDLGHVDVRVAIGGQALGTRRFVTNGWQTVRWDLPAAAPGETRVELHAEPVERVSGPDRRPFGVAIVSLGFLPREGT